MNDAQRLANELNTLAKSPQFSYVKARAHARKDDRIDWPATKACNAEFNPEVDGYESFVLLDGSRCEWAPGQYRFVARPRLSG